MDLTILQEITCGLTFQKTPKFNSDTINYEESHS